jgi:DNA-directed RNA polymerase subunit RPC12/RpoP
MTHAKCNSCNNLNELIQMTPDTKGYRCECGYSYFNKTL